VHSCLQCTSILSLLIATGNGSKSSFASTSDPYNQSREMKSHNCTCIIPQSFPKQHRILKRLLKRLDAVAWKGCLGSFRRKFADADSTSLDWPPRLTIAMTRPRTHLATAIQKGSGKQNLQSSAERCLPVLSSEVSHLEEMQNGRDLSITSESILAAWSDRRTYI